MIEQANQNKSKKYLEQNDPSLVIDSSDGKVYHYANYSKFNSRNDDPSEDSIMSKKTIDKILCSDFKEYYRTYELNEILYLHFKSFKKIENLDYFINLKVLYLEGNSISKIEGLSTLTNLTSLYLHENCIDKIEGLNNLTKLANLNLSDNLISKIENIENLQNLQNFLIKRNRIGFNGLSDIENILTLGKEFCVFDISDNKLSEPEIVEKILSKIPNLRVIYLQGNECVRKIKNYRKTLIGNCKELRYIDDRPIFEDEKKICFSF